MQGPFNSFESMWEWMCTKNWSLGFFTLQKNDIETTFWFLYTNIIEELDKIILFQKIYHDCIKFTRDHAP